MGDHIDQDHVGAVNCTINWMLIWGGISARLGWDTISAENFPCFRPS